MFSSNPSEDIDFIFLQRFDIDLYSMLLSLYAWQFVQTDVDLQNDTIADYHKYGDNANGVMMMMHREYQNKMWLEGIDIFFAFGAVILHWHLVASLGILKKILIVAIINTFTYA